MKVHHMKLSNDGEPIGIKLVAEIMLPNQFTAESYSCAHLGGRKLVVLVTLVAAVIVIDPYFLQYISICGSFSAKPLGSRFFIYDGTEESSFLCSIDLGGCFVL
ncbi:hypothetical protein M0R45_035038 [Rubus argutus]|uniref:Uncharacterized protein n=1 Tax=Rubus argutus TaxID=59490 RepID=A0AAW1VTH4_RUBAR